MIIGSAIWASFLSVNLMRQSRNLFVRRTAIEARLRADVAIHKNESCFGVHL